MEMFTTFLHIGLVFGKNPNFLLILSDQLPALLEDKTSSEIVIPYIPQAKSVCYFKSIRKVETNIWQSKYVTGDTVFYERKESDKWKVSGQVIE